MNDLVLGDSPPVRSVVLRKPGRIRGIRLIHFQSLLDHLHRQMDFQQPPSSSGEDRTRSPQSESTELEAFQK